MKYAILILNKEQVKMTPFQKLFWLFQMGVNSFCAEKVQNKLKKEKTDKNTLQQLDDQLKKSDIALSKTALHPMGGCGCLAPKVMCILEAPSAQEDKTGDYLSGPEGALAQKMLSSIGLDLQKNTYLTYLSPWRPPGNRMLTSAEINQCRKLLNQRIDLIQPGFLLLLGVPVIKALLDGKTLSQVRQGREKYMDICAFGTFAPAWLMKNSDYRRPVWEDLKKFKEMIEKDN